AMPHLSHPRRLLLLLRDRLDGLVRNAPFRLEEVILSLIRIREAVLDRVVGADPLDDLGLCLCHHKHHIPFDAKPDRTRAAERLRTVEQTVVPCREKPALRGELCLPQSLISRALYDASIPLGLGRRPGTQGQYSHPTLPTTILRSHFDLRHDQPLRATRSSGFEKVGIGASDQLLKTVGGLNDELAASRAHGPPLRPRHGSDQLASARSTTARVSAGHQTEKMTQ